MKVLVAILMVLLVGAAGISALFLLDEQSAPVKAAAASQSAVPEIGVMKPVDTMADVMQELSYESAQNKDTVAWLKVPNTTINNSVVQSVNNYYYLRLNERKQEDLYGCYFADYECSFGSREVLSTNSIVYGHSDLQDNGDGLRFSQLYKFTELDFAKRNPYLYFSTIEDYMTWQIFAVFYTSTAMEYIHAEYTPQGLTELVNEAKLKSIYNYGVDVTSSDKILTLSTCSVKYGSSAEQRFVVMAKLLPADAEEVRPAPIEQNPSPVTPK